MVRNNALNFNTYFIPYISSFRKSKLPLEFHTGHVRPSVSYAARVKKERYIDFDPVLPRAAFLTG